MRLVFTIIALSFITLTVSGQTNLKTDDPTLVQVAEVSCGQCNFGLTSKKGCDLAVKINGTAYWVDGTDIESHGDAHGADGFCTTIRKAEIAGELVDGRFKVSYFKLLPMEKSANDVSN